jgi:hypothetical protein
LSLEDIVLATYCVLDDALQSAGMRAHGGKLIALNPNRRPLVLRYTNANSSIVNRHS